MPVVAVINRKGGSGKSTLATHLAAHCARSGWRVMLGDVDRQQSSLGWLRRRAEQAAAHDAPIVGWAVDTRSVLRPPSGITHVVLDTPGGLRGSELARAVMVADAVLVPLCASAFDRESAAACLEELRTLPRVASGRCAVALVGMRLDARSKAAAELQAWAAEHGHPYLGGVREAQAYVRSAQQGLTLFDQPGARTEADLAQWQPILDWLHTAWREAAVAERSAKAPLRPVDRIASVPAMRSSTTLQRSAAPAARRRAFGPLDWLFARFRSNA